MRTGLPLKTTKPKALLQEGSTQGHTRVRVSDQSFGQLSAVCMIRVSEYKGKPLDTLKVDAALV